MQIRAVSAHFSATKSELDAFRTRGAGSVSDVVFPTAEPPNDIPSNSGSVPDSDRRPDRTFFYAARIRDSLGRAAV